MTWIPPEEYVALIRLATLAGYQPTEKEKDWLAATSQKGCDSNESEDSG